MPTKSSEGDVRPLFVQIDSRDNVGIIVNAEGVGAGAQFPGGLTAAEAIPQSHKITLRDLSAGEPVLRYGAVIGHAKRDIPRGSWVREDLMHMPDAPSLDELPLCTAMPDVLPPLEGYTFQGYRNADGTVGTRNILGITTTVQCVAPTVDYAAQRIRAELLPRFPNVDDVVAVTHTYGLRHCHRSTRRGDSDPDDSKHQS
jgi:galactarate dehydratase